MNGSAVLEETRMDKRKSRCKIGLTVITRSMSGVDNEPGNKELEHKIKKG